MKKSILGLITIGVSIIAAHGDVIPTLDNTTATAGGFTWNYTANVTSDQMIVPGSFFTIYDFGTFNPGSNMQPAGWTFSSSLVGTNPSLVTPTDNPNLLNLTWTYTGQTPINGAAALGMFSVVNGTNQLGVSDFAGEAVRNGGPNAGTIIDNVGTISVPIPEMSALLPILSVCGAGFAASVPSLLRRRKKS